ncbi:MAG: hypothetical protein Kow0069_08100 [Promethearchaeota archaeon]
MIRLEVPLLKELASGIFLARPSQTPKWNCNGLVISDLDPRGGGSVLVDCNFPPDDAANLLDRLGGEVAAHVVTHFHLDHANMVKSWEELGVPVFAPAPEAAFFSDVGAFMRENGAVDWGIENAFRAFVEQGLKFRELDHVRPFDPEGARFRVGGGQVQTIHLPGHSPGHVGLLVDPPVDAVDSDSKAIKVLHVSDVGVEGLGAWYGFKYCDLSAVRSSAEKAKAAYESTRGANGGVVLTAGHGEPISPAAAGDAFDSISEKIDATTRRLLEKFRGGRALGLPDLVLAGVYYRKSSMDKLGPVERGLYAFWEGWTLLHHLEELAERGVLREVSPRDAREVGATPFGRVPGDWTRAWKLA